MQTEPLLQLTLPGAAIAKMGGLLSQGIRIKTRVGISLWDFLCLRLDLDAAYVQRKLQTVFVNSRAIDRFDTVYIRDGDVIALSSAMPGLVGATLRRGGHLAGMRTEISLQAREDTPQLQAEGAVQLKLFNVVAREIGRTVLADTVGVCGRALAACLSLLKAAGYLQDGDSCLCNGRTIAVSDLSQKIASDQRFGLRIVWR